MNNFSTVLSILIYCLAFKYYDGPKNLLIINLKNLEKKSSLSRRRGAGFELMYRKGDYGNIKIFKKMMLSFKGNFKIACCSSISNTEYPDVGL